MTSITFADLKVGDKVKILGFKSGDINFQKRLLALGLIPGAEFFVARIAPFGDPIEIKIRHFSLCLRKQEGCTLALEKMESLS